jgi:hypothetical protein
MYTCTSRSEVIRLSYIKLTIYYVDSHAQTGSGDSVVKVASRLQDGGSRNRGSISDRRKRFISPPERTDRFRPHLASLSVGAEDSHPGVKVTGAGS